MKKWYIFFHGVMVERMHTKAVESLYGIIAERLYGMKVESLYGGMVVRERAWFHHSFMCCYA